MSGKIYQQFKVAVIIWKDAWGLSSEEEMSEWDAAPVETVTVGFVVKESDQGIMVTSELWPEYPDHSANLTFIPHCMIVEMITHHPTQTELSKPSLPYQGMPPQD